MRFLIPAAVMAGLLVSCSSSDDTTASGGLPSSASDAVATYANIVEATYQDTAQTAGELDSAAQALVASPSQGTLDAARTAWFASREPYLQSEVFRFYDGPIDNPDDGPEGMINAWPLDEAYIDYVEDAPESGIVNDPAETIDAETLMSLNEQGGEENIATGYHAIEFLLWGQDHSETGPGDRSFDDYTTGADATAPNGDRRGVYLTTTTGLLKSQLDGLVAAWAPGQDNYRKEIESVDPREAFRRILTGMIVLSGFETGGERLQTALDSGSQEDEHSCFSDNTHRDMVQDVQGVKNVWDGHYHRLDGTMVTGVGVGEVIAAVDADLAKQVGDKIDASLALAKALKAPFDQEIALSNTEGRARVEALIVSLREQEKLLEQVFRKLELDIPVSE
ncbi:MAG: iron-regulated protein [Polyangiaceae bacterium]|nr:iron-regulated protein [Polyangiaceae bacterium]